MNSSFCGLWWGSNICCLCELESSGTLEALSNQRFTPFTHSLGIRLLAKYRNTIERGTHFVQFCEHPDGCFPVNASVRDTHTPFESAWAISGDILSASVDVRLDHDTRNILLTGGKLLCDVGKYFGLVVVILE